MTVATRQLTIRYFAAAEQAAGLAEELADAAGTLGDLLDTALARHGAALARVLPACSVLVDGVTTADLGADLAEVSTVDLLPPFAGG